MKRKLLFVINPIAGDTDKSKFYQHLEDFSQIHHVEMSHYQTTGQNDRQEIQKCLADNQPDTVVAVGGDGTVAMLAEMLEDTPHKLGIIPMGSANGMATELNIPEQIDLALETLMMNKVKKIDMLRINEKYTCLHISDIGFNAQLIERFEESERRGIWNYALQFLKEFSQPQAFEVSIETDQTSFRGKAFMVALANAQRYGTGAVLNPIGALDDQRFEICIVKDVSVLSAIDFLLAEEQNPDYLEILSTKSALIQSSSPRILQIDGEIIGEVTQIRVEIIPQCLNVLTG